MENDNANIRHRKEKPRNSRRTLRGEVQVSGGKTRNIRRKDDSTKHSNQRNPRHNHEHGKQKQRSPDQLGSGHNSKSTRNGGLVTSKLCDQIKSTHAVDLLQLLAEQEKQVPRSILMRKDSDSYILFKLYRISPWLGAYQFYKNNELIDYCANKKIAAAWCIADHYNMINLSLQLRQRNNEYNRIINRINQEFVRASTDPVLQDLIEARLSREKARQKDIQLQLNILIDQAKYIQNKGFNNETSRISTSTIGKKRR